MDRDREFTINLPDGGSYLVKLLEGTTVEPSNGSFIGRWPAFDIEAKADTEAELYQELMGALGKHVADGPDAPGYAAFAGYVRERGRLLSDDELFQRTTDDLRENTVRWEVTPDEQYMVKLFRDISFEKRGDEVVAGLFGLEGTGPDVRKAIGNLQTKVNEACGEHDEPGPRFEEITGWVREHGEPVPKEELAKDKAQKQAYEQARDKLPAITPDDIQAESSTGVPLLVDFWAEWCGPCRMVTPVLAELAEEWSGRIVIRKIDVDQFEGIWDRFKFRGIPAMLVFRDGAEIHRVIGFGGKEKLVAELEPVLG